jgi:tetratricopeptide (TPR) repeat protein
MRISHLRLLSVQVLLSSCFLNSALANGPLFSLSPEADEAMKKAFKCENQSKYDEAMQWYNKVVQMGGVEQSHDTLYVNIGSCYEKQQKFSDAIRFYRLYLQKHQDFSMNINIARCEYRLENYELARAELKPLLQSQPGNIEVKALYAMTCYRIKKGVEVLPDLQAFTQAYPDHDAYEFKEAKRLENEILKKPTAR